MQVYLGSAFINDFNLIGRTYRVTAQAEIEARRSVADVANLRVRSDSGQMVPIGSVATFQDEAEPYRVTRYNLFPAVEVDGDIAPGYSSGHSLDEMERIAASLPRGFDYEWTGIAYQQRLVGSTAAVVFAMAVLLVFLVLAAQFESLTLPLSIILILPMCLLAAMAGVNLRGFDNNVLTQIGLIVLIALAAKNAILVVEFARQSEHEGLTPVEAAVKAARMRLWPILMTSFAFILGAVPLAIAQGAGAELRTALGTAVCFGMLGVTGFGLLYTPTFYVVCRMLALRAVRNQQTASALVLRALEETEAALANYRGAIERRRLLQAANDQAEGAARIVRARQREGQVDFLEVLDAERTVAEARAELATGDSRIAHAQIDLFRALGGIGIRTPAHGSPR